MIHLDPVRSALQAAGLRVTAQRVALLTALRSAHGHAAADSLQTTVAATGLQIPLPTVYAVLADLVRAGLIREVRGEAGAARFDANAARHHHLACLRCGALLDIPCADVDDADPCVALEDTRGWLVQTVEVTFRGLCPRCRFDRA